MLSGLLITAIGGLGFGAGVSRLTTDTAGKCTEVIPKVAELNVRSQQVAGKESRDPDTDQEMYNLIIEKADCFPESMRKQAENYLSGTDG